MKNLKLKHLYWNLLFQLHILIFTCLMVSMYLDILYSILIAIILYFYEVKNNAYVDFLEERIEKLESKIKSDEK